jgi:hypothetical protein
MLEVVVYLDSEYKKNKSIFVRNELTKEEITKIVNKKFGKNWYSYDIIDKPL